MHTHIIIYKYHRRYYGVYHKYIFTIFLNPLLFPCNRVGAHACDVAVVAHAHARACAWLPQSGARDTSQQLEKKGGTRKANGGPPVQSCLRPCHEHPGQLPRYVATNRVPKSDILWRESRSLLMYNTHTQTHARTLQKFWYLYTYILSFLTFNSLYLFNINFIFHKILTIRSM